MAFWPIQLILGVLDDLKSLSEALNRSDAMLVAGEVFGWHVGQSGRLIADTVFQGLLDHPGKAVAVGFHSDDRHLRRNGRWPINLFARPAISEFRRLEADPLEDASVVRDFDSDPHIRAGREMQPGHARISQQALRLHISPMNAPTRRLKSPS